MGDKDRQYFWRRWIAVLVSMRVRNWLNWIVGFALAFSCVGMSLLVYSFDQPSLWLPILFSIAFFGLLAFSPNLTFEMRVMLASLFGSCSCILWMVSGADTLAGPRASLQLAFENVLGLIGLISLAVLVGSLAGTPRKARPSVTPFAILMIAGWLISYFSSSRGGAAPMVDWVMRTFGWNQETSESAILVMRKCIHFGFYAFVAMTAFAAPLKNGARRRTAIVASLLTTLSFASFDEMRQTTQPGRTGSGWDVLLDMAGATFALVLVSIISARKSSQRPKGARKSSTL